MHHRFIATGWYGQIYCDGKRFCYVVTIERTPKLYKIYVTPIVIKKFIHHIIYSTSHDTGYRWTNVNFSSKVTRSTHLRTVFSRGQWMNIYLTFLLKQVRRFSTEWLNDWRFVCYTRISCNTETPPYIIIYCFTCLALETVIYCDIRLMKFSVVWHIRCAHILEIYIVSERVIFHIVTRSIIGWLLWLKTVRPLPQVKSRCSKNTEKFSVFNRIGLSNFVLNNLCFKSLKIVYHTFSIECLLILMLSNCLILFGKVHIVA